MNILKRQLALLLVLAMTLTMLPMPTHADEVTDSESPSAIVEETTEQAVVSSEEDSTNTANSPVENAEPDTTAKENTVPAVETPVDTAVGSDATITEELIEDVSESDPKEEPEEVINTDDTTDDTEVEENTDSDLSVDCEEDSSAADIEESEILEASEDNTQEETEQMESELEAPVAMTFSLNRSAVNAAADCAHENTTVTADPREEYWYNLHTDTTKHVANHYIRENCDDCGETVSEVHNYFAEDHVMNENSVCTLCGYTEETASCAHSETEVAWDTNHTITYTPVDATQHKATGYQYTYCTSCFERVGESIAAEEYEEHSLNTSGKCSLCGYQSSENTGCTHENTETAWDTTQPIYYSIYSATQHQIRGFEYTYCNSCFERIGESSWSQQLEDHTLDANGVCDLCSYGRNTCAHENVVFGYAPVYDPPRYEQYNETQHFVYHIMQKSCRDCGEKLSDGEEAGSLEDHVLDDGKCTYCGYGLGENYCTHPDTDIAWDTNYSITYTKIDNNEELTGILHQAEGYQYHYCTSCYKRICDSFPVAEWENHIFDAAGDCTLCNYRVGCEHKQTTMKLYDTLYESLNKDSHEVTRLYSKVCADPDCGKVLVSVETSYTETDIEDHDFTGNTCLLCNYTVTDQLSATVTASVLTANKGDNISATVSVVGGTGGYRFSWKILKDGSVVVENPITTSASCGTNAYEEGSYVFQVTVTDSGGNTVTAQSGAITVSHGCQYETVSNTVLVNQSLTHHTVETTTYEECTICHEKRNEVTDVEWVEHTPMNKDAYGYEASHDNYHQKYFICECGAHPYIDGEYETANGKVQEKSVCCICNGHKYGEAQEAADGTWNKICANCGLSQKVAAPVQPTEPEEEKETCAHVYNSDVTAIYKHPHTVTRVCMRCGSEESQSYPSSNCCQCVGHDWSDVVRLPDGKTYQIGCFRCKESQKVTPSAQLEDFYKVVDMITYRHNEAKKYQEEHSVDSSATAIWKTIADQATDKLLDSDFVTTTETLNTFSDMSGSLVGIFDEESWNQQQIDLWKTLLIQMLQEQQENSDNDDLGIGGERDALLEPEEGVEILSGVFKALENMNTEKANTLQKNAKQLRNEIDVFQSRAPHINMYIENKEYKKLYDEWLETGKDANAKKDAAKMEHGFGLFLTFVGIAADGNESRKEVTQYYQALADLKKNTDNLQVLAEIIGTAEATGNLNLANAAYELRNDLADEMAETTNMFLSGAGAFFQGAAKGGLEFVTGEILDAATGSFSGALAVLELGAKGLSTIVDWGGAYDAAQKLMTVNQMDATMDIANVLKNEDCPYMVELWGLLQAEGCVQAQEFLNAWEDGTGLNSTDLGIDNGGLFGKSDLPQVLKDLGTERNYYITALRLPLEKTK